MIFTIRNIFNRHNSEGALAYNNALRYYIAPYQRGYKWGAASPNDPVCLLMKDVLDAAQHPSSEYYLQFITTKVSVNNGEQVLELIDGQQRITTLTILLSVLASKQGRPDTAVSNYLLSYEVRPKVSDFFNEHIYININAILRSSWKGYLQEYPEHDEQDIFFLFNAAKKIDEILSEQTGNLDALERYVLDNVKIIINNIERDIICEEMFSNLNDNKVDLTEPELIKGLFLTKSARERDPDREISYKEILDRRAVMGRQWDDIANWANRSDIQTFFLRGSNDVLNLLLLSLAVSNGYIVSKRSTDKNELFNFFQSCIKRHQQSASSYFIALRTLKQLLNDWFNDTDIHNLLGYLMFARGSTFSVSDAGELLTSTKGAIRKRLQQRVSTLLPTDICDLEYGRDNQDIYNILLALNIFNGRCKFDFTSFADDKVSWSLEHIFPQSPEELPDKLYEKDIRLLEVLTRDKLGDFETAKGILDDFGSLMDVKEVFHSLRKKMKPPQCTLTLDEKRVLYRLVKIEKLNNIGNMAMLTQSDNSSNGNGMFDRKRHNISKRVSEGRFVPKHTYDVFSKLVSNRMTPELNAWTTSDIDAHEDWMKATILNIKKRFE